MSIKEGDVPVPSIHADRVRGERSLQDSKEEKHSRKKSLGIGRDIVTVMPFNDRPGRPVMAAGPGRE